MAISQPPKDLIMALIKGTTWNTAVDCDVAAKRIPLLGESIKPSLETFKNRGCYGDIVERDERPGKIGFSGETKHDFDFDNHMRPLAQFWGTHSAPAQQGGSAAYTATLSLNKNIQGIFSTICFEKGVELEEYASAKCVGYTMGAEAGGPVTLSLEWVCSYRGWDGSTDYPATTVALPGSNLTYFKTEPLPLAVFNGATNSVQNVIVRMDDQSSGALDSSDNLEIDAWSITCRRAMKTFTTSASAPYIAEPVDNGFTEFSGFFRMPLWQAITYQEDQLSSTKKKAVIMLGGELIASTYYYQHYIWLPQLQITDAGANAEGPETIAHNLAWKATATSSSPTGFADTKPYVTVQNTWTASPLA